MIRPTHRLYVDVAMTPIDCKEPGCVRIIQPGDVVHMYCTPGDGPQFIEPLCTVHAAAKVEDMRLWIRMKLHHNAQAAASRVRPVASNG